jgi:hypothetical protein
MYIIKTTNGEFGTLLVYRRIFLEVLGERWVIIKRHCRCLESVSTRIFILCSREFMEVITRKPFSFSVTKWNKRKCSHVISDQSVNTIRSLPFIENIEIKLSYSVILNVKLFCMSDIMNRLLRYLESLSIGINGDRCFHESFSGFTGPLGIV